MKTTKSDNESCCKVSWHDSFKSFYDISSVVAFIESEPITAIGHPPTRDAKGGMVDANVHKNGKARSATRPKTAQIIQNIFRCINGTCESA